MEGLVIIAQNLSTVANATSLGLNSITSVNIVIINTTTHIIDTILMYLQLLSYRVTLMGSPVSTSILP